MTTVHFFENGIIKKEWKIETHDIINKRNIIKKIECLNKFSCTYCSVSPNAENSLINYSNANKIKLYNLNSKALSKIKTSYPSPNEIGHDRYQMLLQLHRLKRYLVLSLTWALLQHLTLSLKKMVTKVV